MPGGQSKDKKTIDKTTGLIGSQVGLTGAPTNLTGTQTSLADASSEPRGSSKAKNKARSSFKELLDNKGDSQEQKGRPNKAKDTKASFGRQEQSDSQGNCVVVPYSFDVPIAL